MSKYQFCTQMTKFLRLPPEMIKIKELLAPTASNKTMIKTNELSVPTAPNKLQLSAETAVLQFVSQNKTDWG